MKTEIPYSIPKRNPRALPYGFTTDPDDSSHMVHDSEILEVLEEVAEYLIIKALSCRDAAMYLTDKTGLSITHEGLRLLVTTKAHPIFTYAETKE